MFNVSTSLFSLKSWNDKQEAQLQHCERYWSQSWDCLSLGKFKMKGSPRKLVDGEGKKTQKTRTKPPNHTYHQTHQNLLPASTLAPNIQACPQILCQDVVEKHLCKPTARLLHSVYLGKTFDIYTILCFPQLQALEFSLTMLLSQWPIFFFLLIFLSCQAQFIRYYQIFLHSETRQSCYCHNQLTKQQ